MRPTDKNANYVEVPLTLDVQSNVKYLTKSRLQFGYLICVGIVIGALVILALLRSVLGIVLCLAVILGGITIMRLFWFEEQKYKKYLADLDIHDNVYDSNTFWEIYEVDEGAMPICYYKSGLKALFVMFDKDVVIGRGKDGAYNHYDALSQAYQLMMRHNISCTHIDYMDSVGRDTRLDGVVSELLKTPNEKLRKMLATIFEYQQQQMNATYTAYDVYAFYFTGDDRAFKDSMENILPAFLKANYVRFRYMDLADLRILAAALYGIDDFSAKLARDAVFDESGTLRKRLRVISYEKNGEEVKVAKTTEEIAQENMRKAAVKKSKKQAPKMRSTAKKQQKSGADNDVDLWE